MACVHFSSVPLLLLRTTKKQQLFKNNFIEVCSPHHRVQPFQVYNSMFFSKFTLSEISFRTLSPHNKLPHAHLHLTSQPLATSNPLSTHFPILDISYKWNHIICGLFCLDVLLTMFWRIIPVVARISASFLYETE